MEVIYLKSLIQAVTDKILSGETINFAEAVKMINIAENDEIALEALYEGANIIRKDFMGKKVDLCAIINGKSGKCSENCRFCAQSAHYDTKIDNHGFLEYEEILKRALDMEDQGVVRFSIVTSGKGIHNEDELKKLGEIYWQLKKDTNLKLCASHGIISYEQAVYLRKVGVTTYHHNLETSRWFFPRICTTHTYDERVNTIKNVQKASLDVCCGGIIGMGETLEDRISMAFEMKELGVKSVPINILTPIKGTPLQDKQILSPFEILKTMAVFRYILPDAHIRYAGGRMALESHQIEGFKAGINAALVGNYLTTSGSNIEEDKKMIKAAGLEL